MARGHLRRLLPCALLAPLVLSAAGAAEDPWDWHTLAMSAHSGVFLSGRVRLTLDESAERTLLETSTSARFFGAVVARSRTLSTLDPATGRTREYLSFSPHAGRQYVFNEHGYVVRRLSPREGYDAPLAGWDVTSDEAFAYPQGADGPLPVFDPYGMLLHLERLPLNRPGDQAELFVATSSGPRRYTIRVGESRQERRTFRDGATRDRRTLDTEEFRLLVEPEAGGDDERGLLGMRGSVEIWVEARSKTLIRVSGKVPDVPGRVVLKLSALG